MKYAVLARTMLQVFECRGLQAALTSTWALRATSEEHPTGLSHGLSFRYYVMVNDTREADPWHDPTFKPRKRKTYERRDLVCMETRLAV